MLESKEILVSVVLTAYQHEKYIGQCIESVLNQQTNFSFEILIGEDESSDQTREICQNYVNKNPDKIKLFLRSRKDVIHINGHPTGRYNFVETMKAAKGKFIALCDGDDYWTDHEKLQKQIDFMAAHPEIVACHHWQKVASLNKEGKFEEREARTEGHGYLPDTISTVQSIFENKLRLKSRTLLFRNIFRDGFQLPDWFYKVQFGDVPFSMILGKSGTFGFINEAMAVYRMTGEGVSTKGKEDWLFSFRHNIEWIKVWEYGSIYYGNQYRKEALKTIYHFYTVIAGKYNYSFKIFRKVANYVLLESQFTFFRRLRIFFNLLFKFSSGRIKRIFSKK